MAQDYDTIDLRDLVLALRRGSRWIAGGVALGLVAALAVTWILPERYEAETTVLLRNQPEAQLPDLGRLGGGFGGLFPSSSGFETELEILTSRAVVGEVVDSLGMQVRVNEPAGIRADSLLRVVHVESRPGDGRFRFEREAAAYRVTGPGTSTAAAPGSPVRLAGAELILRDVDLPERFEVQLLDREAAITQVDRRLQARRAGGEVARVVYQDSDPRAAAEVPNLLVDLYLRRRTTSDRGVNQRRFDFLSLQADSLTRELSAAEARLRGFQEASGTVDPALRGEAEFTRAMALQAQLETSEVEARTLREILARTVAGSLRSQDLAAYPTFINNPAVNEILSRLLDLDVERLTLLQQRTPADPDIVRMEETRRTLEAELGAITRAYLDGLHQQQQELRRELSGYRSALASLPAEGQQSMRLQREVRRLSETLLALQTQLVGARLEAIREGGDVRRVDAAVAPRQPVFPNPLLNLAVGGFVGGLVGLTLALGLAYLGPRVREPRGAERALGVPVIVFDDRSPLLLAGGERWQGVLVVPVGGERVRAGPVAQRLAETAHLRGHPVALLDLDRAGAAPLSLQAGRDAAPPPDGAAETTIEAVEAVPHTLFPVFRPRQAPDEVSGARVAIEELERRYSPVVVVLRSLQDPFTTALLSPSRTVLLVARQGKVTHAALEEATRALQRFGVTTAGVILSNGVAREPGDG